MEEDSKVTEENLDEINEEKLKKLKYKRLKHLLKNSKAYSKILKDKLEKETSFENPVSKAENPVSNAENDVSPGSKRKKKKKDKKEKKKKRYNLEEILTYECINQNVVVKKEEKEENEGNEGNEGKNEDYFKETKLTNLGFMVSSKQPDLLEGGVLKDYQLKGLFWMRNLLKNGVNGILADEMGLGKTVQTIAVICQMIEEGISGPFLIVAPLSTLANWILEFKKFAPRVPVVLYHGNAKHRQKLRRKFLKKYQVGNHNVFKVVLTSYEVPLSDKRVLRNIAWYYLVVDEGHRLKNYKTQLARILTELKTVGRMLLTGTPLQNNLSELWSLLHFLLPEVFTSFDDFESLLDNEILESSGDQFLKEKYNLKLVNMVQEILHPFLLRREKKDVNLNLPPKKKILIKCPMSSLQKELYEATIQKNINLLQKNSINKKTETEDIEKPLGKRRCFTQSIYSGIKAETSSKVKKTPKKPEQMYITKFDLSNPTMQLRKIVSHPYLVKYPVETGTDFLRVDEELVTQCGKLLVLDALLSRLKARGHKVLIFSFFKIVLDILQDYADMRGYSYARLDGDRNTYERVDEIERFNSEEDVFIFFLSERAGGLGINLTAADTVIMYDSDWNPQVNLQCEDRCHRIGQANPVVVYVLATVGTVDERIVKRGLAKRRLEKMILRDGKYTYECKKKAKMDLMDSQELLELFQTASHDVVYNSNGCVLTDKQLEFLLDRSVTVKEKATQKKGADKGFEVLDISN